MLSGFDPKTCQSRGDRQAVTPPSKLLLNTKILVDEHFEQTENILRQLPAQFESFSRPQEMFL